MGDSFLSKSFLFEVVDSSTEKILESFTLVLPPQSYSVKEKQRVNITKTFGNAFVDDYGPDNIELVIKGISGTAHAFPTFQTKQNTVSLGQDMFNTAFKIDKSVDLASKGTTGYRHKEAFYYFRDNIMRYKDAGDFDKKELRVYDLADQQAYKCVLLEFSVDRNADQPFRYPFTISLFVYARFGSKGMSSAKAIDISKNPLDALDNLLAAMNSLDANFPILKAIQKIKNTMARLNNQFALLRAKFNSWMLKGRNILESPLTVMQQTLETLTILSGFVYDAYTQGKLLVDDYVKINETIANQVREALAMYGFAIQQGSQQSKTAVIEESTGMDYSGNSDTTGSVNSNALAAAPTSKNNSFAYSGLNLYTVTGTDTLQEIAQNYLGDSSLWPYIALVNPTVQSNADLVSGMEIYIPVPNDAISEIKDSFILTEDNERNPYGSDIRLDSNGNMILLESNDLGLISGLDNVLQSIDIRLRTQVGSMIKQTAFGLIAGVGMAGTDAAISYVRMNIQNSLIQDPRIINVYNIKISFIKDSMHINASISLVGAEKSIPISATI